MSPADCLFCRIATGEIPATIVAREDGFLAFEDIAPKAPVHLLVIPERHIASIAAIAEMPEGERAAMLAFIVAVASAAGLDDAGYRVVTNHGPDSRQSVFHMHWHIMGGAVLSETM